MKRISICILIAAGLFVSACNSYLDINTNPNQPTSVTPNLVLSQALVATAGVLNRYNNYGAEVGGYASNAGGYGGFNELVSYAYTTNNFTDLWPYTYDNLEDYQYIIDNSKTGITNIYLNAVATIMRVHDFQLLVDAFNDIPYTEALQGANNLTPKYDDAATVYAGLAVELDSAIARINRGQASPDTKTAIDTYDVIFHGDMLKWKQLANTIKLRLILRGGSKVTFANTTFDAAGFLATDALINPGFTVDNNRENPKWNTWAWAYTGAPGNKAWVPTVWMLSMYDGTNLDDHGRGTASFYEFRKISSVNLTVPEQGTGYAPGTYAGIKLVGGSGDGTATFTVDPVATNPTGKVTKILFGDNKGYYAGETLAAPDLDAAAGGTGLVIPITGVLLGVDIANQQGYENVSAPKCPTGSRWYPGYNRVGTAPNSVTGPLKGASAGYPLITAAESYFMQAEANLTGLIAGDDGTTNFNNGIAASFAYIYQLADGSASGDAAGDAAAYMAKNAASRLVNYSLAASNSEKLEAIITQKYIALDFVNCHEGWNEFRRTGFPTVAQSAPYTATNTFASIESVSPNADRLPTRIQYPFTEAQYNPQNAKTGISPFSSKIFWAK